MLESRQSPTRGSTIGLGRTPALTSNRFRCAVTFSLVGADWEYVNALHATYKFHESWPAGMLCHITGVVEDGVRSIGLWTERDVEQAYFRLIAAQIITDSVQTIGPPPAATDEGGDFEPTARQLIHVIASEAVHAFVDIGEDADASAVEALGTRPVAIDLDLRPFDDSVYEELTAALGYEDSVPEGMIVAWAEREDAGIFATQVWSSEEQAQFGLESEYLPALRRVVGPAAAELLQPKIRPISRISFGSSELDPAWR